MRKQVCKCGQVEGKTTILNSQARVGITTEFYNNGVFKNHTALYIENNFCPQCGAAYEVYEEGQKKLFAGVKV